MGLLLAAGSLYLLKVYGNAGDLAAALLTASLFLAAGFYGGYVFLRGNSWKALAIALPLGLLGHAALVGLFVPGLDPLLISRRTEALLARASLLPSQGIVPGPIAVAGYAEPSLVFGLGTATDLGGAPEAARALAEHRAAVVEDREQPAFQAAAKSLKLSLHPVGEVRGLNYSNGDETRLTLYAPAREALP